MTENELKINGKSFSETISQIEEFMESDDVHGELFTVLRSARDFMENLNEEIQQYREIAKNKHIGKDNMVISSSDLMTILNSDSEELKQYKEVGKVEEFKALKEKSVAKKIIAKKKTKSYLGTDYYCPTCNKRQLTAYMLSKGDDYCKDCGQKLDWSE